MPFALLVLISFFTPVRSFADRSLYVTISKVFNTVAVSDLSAVSGDQMEQDLFVRLLAERRATYDAPSGDGGLLLSVTDLTTDRKLVGEVPTIERYRLGVWLTHRAEPGALEIKRATLTLQRGNGLALVDVLLSPDAFVEVPGEPSGRRFGLAASARAEVYAFTHGAKLKPRDLNALLTFHGTRIHDQSPSDIAVPLKGRDLNDLLTPIRGQNWVEFKRSCARILSGASRKKLK